MQDILVFGKNGQVASALQKIIPLAKFVDSLECNLERPDQVGEFLRNLTNKPSFIVNAAAYTKVDMAEDEDLHEVCLNINVKSVEEMANFCKKNDIILIHYSTDYVFNGLECEPFHEFELEKMQPLNFYGQTKLLADNYIQNSGCKYYIIRVSWVYYEKGSNFVKTMIKLFQEREEVSVVSDQIGSPTYAADIADVTLKFIYSKADYGVYNFTNEGFISWFEFAEEILSIVKTKVNLNHVIRAKTINPTLTAMYQTKAKRAANSRLSKNKIIKALNINLIDWKVSLLKMIENLAKNSL